jgi:peptidoglycan/LPS O-acetylase OafA/YrhL
MRTDYRPDIDGLRAVAVIAVLVFHYFPSLLPSGYVGVDIFFVISGFLITRIIAGELDEGRFTYSGFYGRRVRRIAPALILIVAATVAAGWFILRSDEYAELGRHVAASALFVSNFLLWSEAGYFEPGAHTKPLLHLWSLAVEEQFYIVWPVILALIWRFARPLRVWLILGIVLASAAACILITADNPTAGFYAPWSRLWQLALGGLLAVWTAGGRRLPVPADFLAIAGIGLLAAAFLLLDAYSVYPGWRALLPTCGSALLIAAGPTALFNRLVLANRAAVWIGLISYPLYLWHWPLISFAYILAEQSGDGLLPRSARALLAVTSIALAWATYRFVERPIRRRPRNPIVVRSLAAGIPVFFAVGTALYLAGGLPFRTADSDPRARFLQHYARLHTQGLSAAYRSECDFFDWHTKRRREALPPSCTAAGAKETWFLWGDSHAQSLSLAIRSVLPEGTSLAQVATAGCRPSLGPIPYRSPQNSCDPSNTYARQAIERLKPSVLVLAQAADHETKDWLEIARYAKQAGVRHVVLIGPLPQWTPALPQRIVAQHWGATSDDLMVPANPAILNTDRIMRERFAANRDLTYVSLVSELCSGGACRATIPGERRLNLIAVDYGHLSPDGALFVGRTVLAKPLSEIGNES